MGSSVGWEGVGAPSQPARFALLCSPLGGADVPLMCPGTFQGIENCVRGPRKSWVKLMHLGAVRNTSGLAFSELGFHLSSFLSRSSKLHGGICFANQGLLAGEEKCQSAASLSFDLNGKRFSCFFYFLLTNISVQWVFQDCGLDLT